ncbi:MAG: tRNA epoxyqueuosine(34) reductase QueG [Tepidisphaeraceae bacterium]|jgi:epoxyqueuosine reductase
MSCSTNTIDQMQLLARLKTRARELGFDRIGIAPATASLYRDYFRRWLDGGQAGEMKYLGQRLQQRTDPAAYLPGAVSVICAAVNYHVPLQEPAAQEASHHGRIARYALGEDYHDWLKRRLHALADWLREAAPAAQTRFCTDTAPVMEKELAARAGIGWLGKNCCVINEQIGSWLFLGEIVTTLALPADEAAVDRCGSCRRCIDACPTQAITEPYRLDARRCISYLSIEHRGAIDPELAEKFGAWIYGCDICQEVCPWNREAPAAGGSELQPRFATGTVDARELLNWTQQDYRRHLRGSAMKRAKLPMLKRNAQIALQNLEANGMDEKAGRAQRAARPATVTKMSVNPTVRRP